MGDGVVPKVQYKRTLQFVCLSHIPLKVVPTLTEGITCWMSRLHFRVWIPNLGALPIIASVSLTHLPCLFACFYESVSCVYAFFSTCLSTCAARAACSVFGCVFITTFLFSFFSFYKFNTQLCHGAYWCTHNHTHMPELLFQLHLCLFNSCVCVSTLVHASPSISIFIYIYRRIHVYVLFCSIFTTTFLFGFLLFYQSNSHLRHRAYWCTHDPAHMPGLLFHLHLHFSNSCVCVSKHVWTCPSASIFIHIYCYVHVYVLCDVLYL